jgi:hypothetical protein
VKNFLVSLKVADGDSEDEETEGEEGAGLAANSNAESVAKV